MTSNLTMMEKANAGWNGAPPDWVQELANWVSEKGLNNLSQRLGYSSTTLSLTISNKYRGDLSKVEDKVRGALMGEKVACPVLGAIGRDQCLNSQSLPRAVTNSIRTRLYRACRSGCPHSRLKGGNDA
ncbi:transcriptional regulator [Roseibium album]|uniref:transcriptional regulator n=1 Tax=Roseibium album TaxID=311410 RepID=UPI002493C72A|nr:transcriptional regulator [Roseibium album]